MENQHGPGMVKVSYFQIFCFCHESDKVYFTGDRKGTKNSQCCSRYFVELKKYIVEVLNKLHWLFFVIVALLGICIYVQDQN